MPKVPKITIYNVLGMTYEIILIFLICKLTSLKAPNNTPD